MECKTNNPILANKNSKIQFWTSKVQKGSTSLNVHNIVIITTIIIIKLFLNLKQDYSGCNKYLKLSPGLKV
jgi:hypothetical protein